MTTATMGATLRRHETQQAFLVLIRIQVVLLALVLWSL